MANTQATTVSVFQQALDEFRSKLAQEDQNQFKFTTVEDVQRCILDIQNKYYGMRDSRNMTRLKLFLEAMEQYGKVIEVFLNANELLCFVWVRYPLMCTDCVVNSEIRALSNSCFRYCAGQRCRF
jgi:hypothetical protein